MSENDDMKKWLNPPFTGEMQSHQVNSATDSTGAIPTPPLTDEDVEGYLDIIPVPQRKAECAVKSDTPEEQKKNS